MNLLLRKTIETLVRKGDLTIVSNAGRIARYGDGSGPSVRVRFSSAQTEWRLAIDPDLALGEGFMDGTIVVEDGTLYDFINVLFANAADPGNPFRELLKPFRFATRRLRQRNTRLKARANVLRHYDLDQRLYALFLDDDLQYSCAYFETLDATLDEAQLAKKRHLAAKLALRSGQRLLDIGSGWGGLGLYLAGCGVDVTGVTLSTEQHEVSSGRSAAAGMADRARFELRDYRSLETRFDRIVSVGMFEHVGVGHYDEFFGQVARLLTDDGVMVLHSIGRFGPPGRTSRFIEKYIFPGGYIPALSEVIPAIERQGLAIADIEILRLHYAETLRRWRERFMARRKEAVELYDERFARMWEYYLIISEISFRVQWMMNFQIQLVRQQTSLPMTRDYMAATEETLRARDAPERRLSLAGE